MIICLSHLLFLDFQIKEHLLSEKDSVRREEGKKAKLATQAKLTIWLYASRHIIFNPKLELKQR